MSLLQDIGVSISDECHHKHLYYLVNNGDLRLFEPEEAKVRVLVARYHFRFSVRFKSPRKNPPDYWKVACGTTLSIALNRNQRAQTYNPDGTQTSHLIPPSS